jgi:hypothetical protein
VVVAVIVIIINDDDDDDYVGSGGDANDNSNGDVRCEAFTTAAEGIKSSLVTSCANLEQTPLF